MNIVQEKVDALNALAKVEIKREDYEPKLNIALRDYSKKMDLKGFRKGKVPMSLVKKMYGNSVLIEEINRMINDELNEFLKSEKIEILGQPIPKADQNIKFDINDLKIMNLCMNWDWFLNLP